MPSTRRTILTAGIGLATPFIQARAAPTRSLTFAAYGGLFQTLYEPAIVEAFQRTHPDIGIFYYALPSSTQALGLLRRQRGLPQIDVALLDLPSARMASDEGLLDPIPAGTMPVLSELSPGAIFPGVAGPAVFTEPLAVLYDPATIRPPPVSWMALWNDTGQKLAIPAPPDPIGLGFTAIAAKLFAGGGDVRSLIGGVTAIAGLSDRTVSWDPRPDVYRFIGEGRASLGVGWNMPAQWLAARSGGRLGVAIPDDAVLSRTTTICLVKGNRQPEAARQFLAHTLGVEAQKTMVETMFLGPVNARARYADAAIARTANTPARLAHAIPVDWTVMNMLRDDIEARWRDTVLKTD